LRTFYLTEKQIEEFENIYRKKLEKIKIKIDENFSDGQKEKLKIQIDVWLDIKIYELKDNDTQDFYYFILTELQKYL